METLPEISEEERTFEFSCSSEAPYNRYGYVEILSHEPGAIKLDRLNDGAALLFNHDWDELIGVITKTMIDAEQKKLRVTVKLSQNEDGREALQDIKDGILTKVSIGYVPLSYEEEGKNEDGLPIYRVTEWEPYEVSLVTVPADTTVGIGKSAEPEPKQDLTIIQERRIAMTENTPNIDPALQERNRVSAILSLGKTYKADVAQFISDGTPVETVIRSLSEAIKVEPVTLIKEPELTPKEKKVYSLRAVYEDLMTSGAKPAGFEREVSQELQRVYNQPAQGIIVPYGILARDWTSGGAATGAELKGTDHLGGEFVPVLRNKMVTLQAGVRVLPGLKGNVDIPKQSSASTLYWATEVAGITESTPGTASVTLSPKRSGAYVEASYMLLTQSDPSAESLIQNDLMQVLAIGWDKAILEGTGAPQPTGIANTSNIGAFSGPGISYADILDAIADIETANADVANMFWITEPGVKAVLRGRAKETGYPDFLMAQDGTIEGYRSLITNQMTAGTMLFGDFSQAILGLWGGIDLKADPFTKLEYGIVRFVAQQLVDVAVRQPGAFTYASGIN